MRKNILITGSTDGIGKLTALRFAREGHFLYLHGRNKEKLKNVISEIKSTSGNNEIQGFVSDFSDLKNVLEMVNKIKISNLKLDVLINNAGVFKSDNSLNQNSLDIRFVVNYLAPYLLTNSLLDVMNDNARILNLSSRAQTSVDIEVLRGNKLLEDQEAYAQSKLALTMWSFYLSKKLKNISVVAVNPGSLLNTKMVKEAFGTHWAPAEKGAEILYDLSFSEKYRSSTGEYYDNDKGNFGKAHVDAYSETLIEKLIEETEKLLGKIL